MNNNPCQDTAKLLAALEEEIDIYKVPETDEELGKYEMATKYFKKIGFGEFESAEANQLREERDEYKKLLNEKHDELCKVTTLHGKEIERCAVLGKENAKLVKALEWYRDNSDAYVTSYGADPCGISKRATAVLSELRGREEQ